jgi:hypothetical protein
MGYYDAYNARLSISKTSPIEYQRDLMQRVVQKSFFASPSYYQVTQYAPTTPSVSSTLDVWVIDQSETKDFKEIQVYPGQTLNYGDYILWQGDYWLVLQVDNMGDVYQRGYMQKCLSSLKWLDENGEVKEAWFTYKTDSSRGLGLEQGKVMLLPNERRYIFLQNNSDTVKLEKGKRFIFDNRSWRVTSIDRLNTGLIYFELEEFDINPASDNVVLRIADYVGNIPNYTLKILNGSNLSIRAGQTYQLNVEVRNNGVLTTKSLTFTSSNPSIATVSSTGLVTTIANGEVVITVALADNPSINQTVDIVVQLVTTNNYTVSILGDDFIYCNTSKTYNEQVKNNGVVDNTRFVQWYLYDDSGVNPTTLATISFQSTTQCTLTANNKNQKGFVKLKAVVIGNPTVIDVKRIEIRTLI